MPEKTKVLLATADANQSLSLGNALQREGWQVIPVADAVMAQSAARQQQPQVAVVDMRLPGGGGARVLQRLRTTLATSLMPALALADADATHAELKAAGAQECLTKPVLGEQVTAAVRRLLGMTLAPETAPDHVIKSPERLRAVHNSGWLDTAPEPALDVLTRIAAALCGTPTALLSVVDADRQFFKSAVGLHERWQPSREAPIQYSFCQWAVASGEALVITDARTNPLVRHNPAVKEQGVVAYAGVPVGVTGGPAVGSFCVADSKTRDWSEHHVRLLGRLADIALAEIGPDAVAAPRTTQLAASVNAALHILAEDADKIAASDRQAFATLAARHTDRLAAV
jgi:CheY-like chemotaxis protein